MIIGRFEYDSKKDCYRGQIRTLTLQCDKVELRPQTRGSDREPAYRVIFAAPQGDIDFGAAWKRRTDRGQDYLSVLLDDPSLDKALSAALFIERDGSGNLVWSRLQGREAAHSDKAEPGRHRMKPGLREPANG